MLHYGVRFLWRCLQLRSIHFSEISFQRKPRCFQSTFCLLWFAFRILQIDISWAFRRAFISFRQALISATFSRCNGLILGALQCKIHYETHYIFWAAFSVVLYKRFPMANVPFATWLTHCSSRLTPTILFSQKYSF
jgi:hypothetical protein